MTILAKRFQFLDHETNVSTADFFKQGNETILNSPINELKAISAELEGFIGNAKQIDLKSLIKKAANTAISNTRVTRNTASNLRDLSQLAPREIEGIVSNLIPNQYPVQSIINQLPANCRDRGLSQMGSGRPYSPTVNCNGHNNTTRNGCGNGEFGNAINQMTGGTYNSQYTDLNSLLNNLISMAGMGYNLNMCGVFTALAANINNVHVLSRASAVLLSQLTASRNMNGIFDLSSASINLHTHLENPNAAGQVFEAMPNIDRSVRENELSSYTDQVTGSAEIFDANWNKSLHDAKLSTRNIKPSKDTRKLFRGKVMNTYHAINALDVAPIDDHTFLSLAVA